MIVAPCKDCQDRVLHCHGSCEKYLAFKAHRAALNNRRHMENLVRWTDKSWFIREKWRKEKIKR